MPKRSLAEKAAAMAAKTHRIKKPQVVDRAEAVDPKSGTPLYLFRVVGFANANKPAHLVILNERGEAVEAQPVPRHNEAHEPVAQAAQAVVVNDRPAHRRSGGTASVFPSMYF